MEPSHSQDDRPQPRQTAGRKGRWGWWVAFALGGLYCVTPWASPFIALGIGILLALALSNPAPRLTRRLADGVLQASVVLLGFALEPAVFSRLVIGGMAFATISLASTLLAGLLVGRMLGIPWRETALISGGTAVCGGSAIAAIGPVIKADEKTMNVAAGTVFLLNAAALYTFPLFGHALNLDPRTFGVWVGVAVHDISSVVSAAEVYGTEAIQTGTLVKLSRVIWILPIAWCARWLVARRGTAPAATSLRAAYAWPWVIVAFAAAACARRFVPGVAGVASACYHVAIPGLILTLFLVGACISRESLKAVGWKSLVLGTGLWALVSLTSLILLLAVGQQD